MIEGRSKNDGLYGRRNENGDDINEGWVKDTTRSRTVPHGGYVRRTYLRVRMRADARNLDRRDSALGRAIYRRCRCVRQRAGFPTAREV